MELFLLTLSCLRLNLTTYASIGANIVREIVIPELTNEVNEDKNFAQLRQVYNSLILATWYKKKIKDSILAQVYADKNKTAGVQYISTVIPAKVLIPDIRKLLRESTRMTSKQSTNAISKPSKKASTTTLKKIKTP